MDQLIVPAIIAKNQKELDDMLSKVKGKVRRIMMDIMDGEFVPNTSLDFAFKLQSGPEYEAHLMVGNPLDWIGENPGKVDIAIMHVETIEDIETSIDFVRKKGLGVTLAINPDTGLDTILPYLDMVKTVLVMTVHPGKYGGEFLPEALEKVRTLREIDEKILIEVDGGMNPENARLARAYGANIIASGSYIFKSHDLDHALMELKSAISG